MAEIPIYILMDDDPYGGYFAAQSWAPNLEWERKSIREVRMVMMDEELWNFMLNQGGLPLDPDGSNDSTWRAYWKDAEFIWSRS